MTPEEFAKLFGLTEGQKKQFERYFELLVEWNEKMNLTSITEKSEVYLKHFYDSCAPIFLTLLKNEPLDILDIGAGAGFPSLPMKIIFPELKITIIDSLAKRISFLEVLKSELHLSDIQLLHGRAEDFGQDEKYREQFEIVLARAVARLNVLSELTLPFLHLEGRLFSYKASKYKEELEESRNALRLLGGELGKELDYRLSNGDERHLIVVKKAKAGDKKYPRRAGIPNKSPL